MVKIAASAVIRLYIATCPRAGRSHSSSAVTGGTVVVLITPAPLFVLPVRIIRMLKVPEGAAALDRWYEGEVVCRRRRLSGPFESPGIPWIASSRFAAKIRPDQVSQEDQDPRSLEENSDGHNQVPGVPAASRFIRVDSSRHAEKSRDMHEVEGQVEADKEKPEMQFAKRLAVHLSRHLWEPVVEGSEKGEHNAPDDHVVKMSNNEIRASQLPVEWRCTQHDSSEACNQKLEEEGNAEQHRGLELDLSSPHGRQPVEDLDAGRNRNGHGRDHKKSVGRCAHADSEHMVGPYAHADEPDRDGRSHHHRVSEDRLAGEDRYDFRGEGEGWKDKDVNFGMSENPEEVHPNHR